MDTIETNKTLLFARNLRAIAEKELRVMGDRLMQVSVNDLPFVVSDLIKKKIPHEDLERARRCFEEQMVFIEKNRVQLVNMWDKSFPAQLSNIYDRPLQLMYIGKLDFDYQRSISMVGSRKFSTYGKYSTEIFSKRFAEYGYTICSGMAMGIDTLSHVHALKSNGKCIGVVGHGLDIVYPPSNIGLYEKVKENGAIVSEYLPFVEPRPYFFPQRNRIIAALSRCTLVIEGSSKSGSLISARLAFDYNREVYAIPRDIDVDQYQGTNTLIREGIAKLVITPEDILHDQGIELSASNQEILGSGIEDKIVSMLGFEKKTSDDLSHALNISLTRIMSALTNLELAGKVRNFGNRWGKA